MEMCVSIVRVIFCFLYLYCVKLFPTNPKPLTYSSVYCSSIIIFFIIIIIFYYYYKKYIPYYTV
jgi:hypothetical protein